MGRIRLLILLLLSAVIFTSCGVDTRFSDYRRNAFSADIEYYYDGELLFCGIVEVDEETESETRDIRITLTSPEAMRGATVYRENGEIRIRIGEREMRGDSFSAILSGAELIIPVGDHLSAEKLELSGKMYIRTKFASETEIYFDPDTQLPVEIRKDGQRLVVRKMTVSSENKNEKE